MTQVIIDRVTSQVRAIDGVSPETIRVLAQALLPMVREMLEHDRQVAMERSVANGYADRLNRGAPS